MARPSKYSPIIAAGICEQIATTNKSLKTICKDAKMPHVATVFRWLGEEDKKEFRDNYARAQECRADLLAEDIIEIADDNKKDEKAFVGINHIHRAKLRIDTRKLIASKLKPKKYGDKIEVDQISPPHTDPMILEAIVARLNSNANGAR
jgi:hypothetical protein